MQFNDVTDIFRIFWNRAGVQMIHHSYPKSKLVLVLVMVTFCEQSQKCYIHSCIHPGLGTGAETCSIIGHAVMVLHRLVLQSTSVIQSHMYSHLVLISTLHTHKLKKERQNNPENTFGFTILVNVRYFPVALFYHQISYCFSICHLAFHGLSCCLCLLCMPMMCLIALSVSDVSDHFVCQ